MAGSRCLRTPPYTSKSCTVPSLTDPKSPVSFMGRMHIESPAIRPAQDCLFLRVLVRYMLSQIGVFALEQ